MEITWSSGEQLVPGEQLATWEKRLATLETLAHLESMRVDGAIDRRQNGIIYYRTK